MTYNDLLMALQNLTPAQLEQSVMILPDNADGDKSVGLLPIYCLDSIQYFCHSTDNDEILQQTRSSNDNKHHPEQFVLLADDNPFSEEGDFYYELTDSGWKGNKTGKIKHE